MESDIFGFSQVKFYSFVCVCVCICTYSLLGHGLIKYEYFVELTVGCSLIMECVRLRLGELEFRILSNTIVYVFITRYNLILAYCIVKTCNVFESH